MLISDSFSVTELEKNLSYWSFYDLEMKKEKSYYEIQNVCYSKTLIMIILMITKFRISTIKWILWKKSYIYVYDDINFIWKSE